jgi:hypothetical protein
MKPNANGSQNSSLNKCRLEIVGADVALLGYLYATTCSSTKNS